MRAFCANLCRWHAGHTTGPSGRVCTSCSRIRSVSSSDAIVYWCHPFFFNTTLRRISVSTTLFETMRYECSGCMYRYPEPDHPTKPRALASDMRSLRISQLRLLIPRLVGLPIHINHRVNTLLRDPTTGAELPAGIAAHCHFFSCLLCRPDMCGYRT